MPRAEGQVLQLRAAVLAGEVSRYLGYPRDRQPPARFQEILDQLWPRAESMVQARGAYRIVAGEEARRCGMPESTELVGVGVCTVGPALEQESQALIDSGELVKGVVLDAFGSAAAEAAADALNQQVCAQLRARELRALPRVSPGYGEWDVSHQRALLAHLPIEQLKISLTDGMMMIPRKSVSFAVGAVAEGGAHDDGDASFCDSCSLLRCPFRRG